VQSSQSFNFVPLYIAETEGYFKDEGLQVEVILAGGGPKAMTALLGGGGQFSASVLFDGIMAQRRGLDDVRAMATLSYFQRPFVLRTDVAKAHGITRDKPLRERVAAMKDLRIGITTPGATSDLTLRYLLSSNGLQPDRDVQIVPVGGVSTSIAALQAGQIDGCSCLPGVDVMTERQGLTVDILNPEDMNELNGVTYGTLYGLASYNKAHPEIVRAMARAITRATLLLARDPDAARGATRPFFKEMDEATFDTSWSTYLPDLPKSPDITQDSFDKELAFEKAVLPANVYKPVPYDEAVDASAVRAAMRELTH
jgi:NitT/TauT family transport system substrate-binding protein